MSIDEKLDKAIDGIRESRIACLDAIHTLSDIKTGMLSGHQKIADEAYQRGYQHAKNECEDCPKNVDFDAIRKEAFDEGYKEGMQLSIDDAKLKEEYRRGLNDAWDAARKIGSNSMCSLKEMGFDFGQCVINDYNPCWFVVKNYSVSECIEKIRQYEQEHDSEIKVGDEVDDGDIGIVTRVFNNGFYVMWPDGTSGFHDRRGFRKTGRHFPEIAEVIKKMREQ